MFALDGSFPAKPTTCSVIAVAVVRTVAYLESEELVGRRMVEAQQTVVEASSTLKVAHATIHVIDVPINTSRVHGGTSSVILETTTVGNVIVIGSQTFINEVDVPNFCRVFNTLNHTRQNSLSRFKTLQIQTWACWLIVLGIDSVHLNVVHHKCASVGPTDGVCCGCCTYFAVRVSL